MSVRRNMVAKDIHSWLRPARLPIPHHGCSVVRDAKGLASDWAKSAVITCSEPRAAAMRMARSVGERLSTLPVTEIAPSPSRGGSSIAGLWLLT